MPSAIGVVASYIALAIGIKLNIASVSSLLLIFNSEVYDMGVS